MPWEKIIPASSGQHGGRKPTPPSARLDRKNKLLMLNKSAGELLGNPPRVVVEADRQRQAIRLSPAVEDDQSAYVFSGGGNSPRRIRAAEIMKKIEHDGHFEIKKKSGKIVLQVK